MPWYEGTHIRLVLHLSFASFSSLTLVSRQLKILVTPVPAREATLQHRLVTVVQLNPIRSPLRCCPYLPRFYLLIVAHFGWLTSLTHHD
jgi:hypothetical protein